MLHQVLTTGIRLKLALVLLLGVIAVPAMTPTPAAAHEPPECEDYKGSHPEVKKWTYNSKDVEHLQCLLNVKFDADLAVDGDFGPKTDKAVRDVQRSQGLKIDGIVGDCTWEVLHHYPYDYPDDPNCYRKGANPAEQATPEP